MAKDKRNRMPRPPATMSLLPKMTFAEVEEEEILAVLEQWYGRAAEKLSSEASHTTIRDDILRQLGRGDGASLPAEYIVAMADAGHPPADHALRIYIDDAIDFDRFNDMPLRIRAFAGRALKRPLLPIGYPPNRPQVVNDNTRNIAICYLIDQTVARWPHVPKLHSNAARHSAAWLLALIFTRHGTKLSERHVRRIYEARGTFPRQLAEFLIADLPFE